ncbi:hypothetical protein JCM19239_6033 [Vibrio variabilis]|uniref:Uncharacterized protein n=1 Tax=Vibrio variabilis TaxID=990271 RepID=A0ABQ0JLQ2_9VIBR|nr:hypothetical protein JCM19239_6033 [Vibrio variabilis]
MIEARVAKLESDVEYIKKDIADIKLGMSEMRVELKSDISELRTELKGDIGEIRTHQRSDFKLLFGTLITITLSLAGIMAKGFGWL